MIGIASRRLASTLSTATLCIFLFWEPASAANGEAPKVVVTIKPVHSLVAGIMEGVGTPRLLVEGSASAHTFAMKPSAARAVYEADLVIRVSPALEPFTAKLAEGLASKTKLLTLADTDGIHVLPQRRGGTFEAHGSHTSAKRDGHEGHADHDAHDTDDADEGHAGRASDGHGEHPGNSASTADGHLWLDPENAKIIVAKVAEVLAAADAAHAEAYRANAAKLTARIEALQTGIAAELSPVAGRPFVVFHDAYHYFERRFGLTVAGSITISPDVQPSALRLSQVRNKIAALGAVCVFAEPAFQPKLVAAVTEGSAARSGSLDPEGMGLEPGRDLYFELMQRLSSSIKTCLSPPA